MKEAPAPVTKTEPVEKPVVTLALTVPAGTPLIFVLASSVASDQNKVEDKVTAKLGDAVSVDGREVLPAGAEVVGIVTQAEKSGRVKGRAKLGIRFEEIRSAGKAYRIQASISIEADPSTGSDVKSGVLGGAAGAVIGGVAGGKKGAVIGAAAGAAGAVILTKGKEVELARGTRLPAKLAEALTVMVVVR